MSDVNVTGFPNPYLSASQINCYLRCPAEYYMRYVMGIKMPTRSSMSKGKAVHSANEVNLKQKIASHEDMRLDDVLDVAAAEFDKLVEETEFEDEETPGQAKDIVVALTELYHQELAPKIQPVAVEERIEFTVDGLEVPVIGFIDVIDDTMAIIDTKTTGKSPSEAMIKKSLQLSAYCLGFREKYATNEAAVRLDYLVSTKKPKVVSYRADRSDEDLKRFCRIAVSTGQNIKAKNFYPNPTSMMCSEKSCQYWDLCQTLM